MPVQTKCVYNEPNSGIIIQGIGVVVAERIPS
jgi:hypothetical protein